MRLFGQKPRLPSQRSVGNGIWKGFAIEDIGLFPVSFDEQELSAKYWHHRTKRINADTTVKVGDRVQFEFCKAHFVADRQIESIFERDASNMESSDVVEDRALH